jgi:hypothetical protein
MIEQRGERDHLSHWASAIVCGQVGCWRLILVRRCADLYGHSLYFLWKPGSQLGSLLGDFRSDSVRLTRSEHGLWSLPIL